MDTIERLKELNAKLKTDPLSEEESLWLKDLLLSPDLSGINRLAIWCGMLIRDSYTVSDQEFLNRSILVRYLHPHVSHLFLEAIYGAGSRSDINDRDFERKLSEDPYAVALSFKVV